MLKKAPEEKHFHLASHTWSGIRYTKCATNRDANFRKALSSNSNATIQLSFQSTIGFDSDIVGTLDFKFF